LAGGGEGEGERCRVVASTESGGCCGFAEEVGGASANGTSSFSESDDDGEGDDDDSSTEDGVACFLRGAFCTGVFVNISSDEESEEPDEDEDDDDDARRRLRFLLRFRGAVGLAVGILWCSECRGVKVARHRSEVAMLYQIL